MKEPIFKPDFKDANRLQLEFVNGVKLQSEERARYQLGFDHGFEVCREQIEKLVKSASVVYGHKEDARIWKTERSPRATNNDIEMHPEPFSARLLFIEPIAKEECKHEVYIANLYYLKSRPDGYPFFKCRLCNIELKATWEAVK